jgi:site-specific DNA-cytosine methylase
MMHNAIGAHIYAGGFTVGIKKHFNVLAHLEHAAYGEEVIRLNYQNLPVYAGGPEAWKPFLEKLPRGKDRPRFIFANPPCAIWSGASAGRVTEWHEDPRLQFHHDIFDLLGSVEPDVMAIESVPPIFTKGRAHVDDLIARAKTLGYSTTVVKHNAMWMGVAQKRGRIFLAFHRINIDWEPPNFEKTVTVRQAIKGLPKRTKGYDPSITSEKLLELLRHTEPGGRVRNTFDTLGMGTETGHRGQVIGRPSFLDTRFPLDKVGPIVLAGKSIHPTEARYMNQEELAAICSFPPDYKWPSRGFGDISGFMSRGVMPRVGEWLAENVARAIDAGKRSNEQTALVYDVTGPPGTTYELPTANPATYHDMKSSSGGAEQLDLPWEATGELSSPTVITDPVPSPKSGTAIVEWSPRLCGSVAFGGHLSAAGGDRISFSKSGNPLASWRSPWNWEARKIDDAAAILNDYDKVVLVDIACFAPNVSKSANGRPYYEDVMKHVTRKWTGMFHGGLYSAKHDETLDAIFSSPGFSGALVTTRLRQAAERLAKWPIRFEHHPYLPYDPSAVVRRGKKDRTREVMITSRLMSNKGQNALLAVLGDLNGHVNTWGYNAFGFPSTGWGLWELGTLGLKYKAIKKPNQNAVKFNLGTFAVRAKNGSEFRYHGDYTYLNEVDWSPWLSIVLSSPDFADTIEYVTLDAIHAGSVALVPENAVREAAYSSILTVPYEGTTITYSGGKLRGTDFDRAALTGAINRVLGMSDNALVKITNAQFAEISALHAPSAFLAAVDRALGGGRAIPKMTSKLPAPKPGETIAAYVLALAAGGTPDAAIREAVHAYFPPAVAPRTTPSAPIGAARKAVAAPAAVPGRPKAAQTPMPSSNGSRKPGSGARIREMLLAGRLTPDILAVIHSEFPGSKAGPSDVSWNKQKLRNDARAAGLPPPL